MNQQRQVTPATIDLTPAHQVLRARVMGAIDCDPRFRIKRLNHEGDRTSSEPNSIPSDTISNHCATSDLLVSFDGSLTYMLQCEVKTTRKKFGDRTAPEIFRDVKHVEYSDSGKRNLRQFEKLSSGGGHYWWYVIAQVHGLNEDDQDQLESEIGDQPAILIEGKAPYPEAIKQHGPMRLNALLKVVRERTGAIAERFPMGQASSALLNPPSREQLAFPMDDVPVVTMDMPLRSSVTKVEPIRVEAIEQPTPQPSPVDSSRWIDSTSFFEVKTRLSSEWIKVGEQKIIDRVREIDELWGILDQVVQEHAADRIVFLEKNVPNRQRRKVIAEAPTMCMLLAIACERYRNIISGRRTKFNICNKVFPEASFMYKKGVERSINLLRVFGYEGCRS